MELIPQDPKYNLDDDGNADREEYLIYSRLHPQKIGFAEIEEDDELDDDGENDFLFDDESDEDEDLFGDDLFDDDCSEGDDCDGDF